MTNEMIQNDQEFIDSSYDLFMKSCQTIEDFASENGLTTKEMRMIVGKKLTKKSTTLAGV